MTEIVGAKHDFHDIAYAVDWAARFTPAGPRQQLFDTIVERLRAHRLPHCHVVELGIGPGYLAHEVLSRIEEITYEGIDFSQPMFQIAGERLSAFGDRLMLTQADLTADNWINAVKGPVDAVITTWALHDLGNETNIFHVYQSVRQLLPADGLLLNGDFVKPDGVRLAYEPGRLPIARHLDLLTDAGFRDVQCLAFLDPNTENPTSANNYACFQAICP